MALVVVLAALTGCALGQRPSLVEQASADDPASGAVLDLFDRASSLTFTADYDITPSLTGQITQATVVQSGERQRITIGDVEYIDDGINSRTCTVGTDECVFSFDDARVSNLSVTHAFWSNSVVGRLTTDASRTVGPSVAHTDTIAGRPATCVDLPVPTAFEEDGVGQVTYCAIDDGVLGRYRGADVTIELTAFEPTADEALLAG
jgi:hypothetical protein